MIFDMLSRGWDDFIARLDGPLHFRFIFQPAVSALIAVFAGLSDARAGRPAYLWMAIVNADHRKALLDGGWKDVRNVFLIALILDTGYQIVVQHRIYPLELLFTAGLLALTPYFLLRGPINCVARTFFVKNCAALNAPTNSTKS